ncbi:porin [Sphingopyxis sp. OAS728]|uniref:carbohydrate porin n=1 Tax=Sphingopyxis sp. OAS728 TaxID=2663823 RepID=UPI0019E8FD13|nr:carbohydrate porin [Sphingopyxis sp. OAS728]MBE1529133.1 porin [Sphingopyxis sp. OAS728]
MTFSGRQIVAPLLMASSVTAAAQAQESADEATPAPTMAGDVLGLRPRLADAGIELTGHYVAETAWNFSGGQRQDVTETGEFGIGLQFDMQRIAGTDGSFQATMTYRHGPQLDTKAGLGTLQEVQEIYGRGRTWRLTQFWYEQRFANGAIAVKAGRTAPSEDFSAFSCTFQNLSFCGSQPGNIVTDYWYNWPVSQWGLRLRAAHRGVYAQIGVYEENPRNLDKSFTIGRFKGATGALIPIELGLTRGGDGGPVGSYKIGGWVSTADAPDLFLDVDREPAILTGRAPLQRGSAHGVWLAVEQQVSGRSARGASISGVSVFFNALAADRRTSRIDNQIVAGLFVRDPLPGVAGDMVGFGVARTHVNNRLERAELLAGQPPRGAEYAFELFYGFKPVGWLDLRPNVQWIHHPGGRRDARAVGVAGLKAVLRL